MNVKFLAYWKFYDVRLTNDKIIVIGNDASEFNWGVMPLDDALERRIKEAAEKYRPDDANKMRLVIEAFDEFAERRPVVRFSDTDVWEENSRYYWSDNDLTRELKQEINANYIGWDTRAGEYVYFPDGLAADSVPLENYFLPL